MDMSGFWFWLAIGLIPYRVERCHLQRGGRRLELQALFWSLSLYSSRKRKEWVLRVPLIERLREALWTVVLRIAEDVAREGQTLLASTPGSDR